jgi:hypothetical protein
LSLNKKQSSSTEIPEKNCLTLFTLRKSDNDYFSNWNFTPFSWSPWDNFQNRNSIMDFFHYFYTWNKKESVVNGLEIYKNPRNLIEKLIRARKWELALFLEGANTQRFYEDSNRNLSFDVIWALN